jgi:TolB-like protein
MEKAITQKSIFDPDPLPYTNTNPIVAIFPFKSTLQSEETDAFSVLLCEELSAELSRFQDISVIGYYSIETTARIKQNVLEAGRLIGADYIITGSLQYEGGRIRVRVNLVITATGEVAITKSLTKQVSGKLIEIQDEIIQSAVNSVGSYYGTIFRKMGKIIPMKIPYNITNNLSRLRTITKRFGPLDRRLRS